MTTLRNKLTAVREQIREAYHNGATLRQIGELHNASPGTVRLVLMGMNEKLRPRGRRRRIDMQDPRLLCPELVDELELDEAHEEMMDEENNYEGGAF